MKKGFLVLVVLSLVLAACGKSPATPADEATLESLATNFSTATHDEFWNDAAQTISELYTVGQTKDSPVVANKGDFDAVIFKYDYNGNAVWKKQIGSAAFDMATDAAVNTSSRQIYALGATDGQVGGTRLGGTDLFVVRYDLDGNNQKLTQFGTTGNDRAIDIVLDSNQIPYVLADINNSQRFAIYKGNLTTFTFTELPLSSVFLGCVPKALGIDTVGNFYVLCDDESNPTFPQVSVEKYSSTGTFSGFQYPASGAKSRGIDITVGVNRHPVISYNLINASNQPTGVLAKLGQELFGTTGKWTVNLGLNFIARTVKISGDSSVYVGGSFGGRNYAAKFTTAGAAVWSKTFSLPGHTGTQAVFGLGFTPPAQNGIFAAGLGNTGTKDGFVKRMNATTGDEVWLRQ